MKADQVVTFTNTHAAMKAEDIFSFHNKLDFELIPTPREISAECGFALLVRNIDTVFLYNICQKNNLKIDGIYLIKIINGVKHYEKSY